jgi:hypothetical protein
VEGPGRLRQVGHEVDGHGEDARAEAVLRTWPVVVSVSDTAYDIPIVKAT